MTIGFIGQGYIGKNYADDFEKRGHPVIRYALEEPYAKNKEKIKECDVVFIAVPTPTTPQGFDASILEGALRLVRDGATVVIKSTILPGTTVRLQETHPRLTVLYSPEFLSEATAAQDAARPFANIVGAARDTERHKKAAHEVHTLLPAAPYALTCTSNEAEVIKYSHNGSGYVQIVFFNMMYDLARELGCDWRHIEDAVQHDPLVSNRYARPVHKSGRGAGGHCFIKDFAALREVYAKMLPHDERGQAMISGLEQKNIALLKASGKDLDLLRGVYGDAIF